MLKLKVNPKKSKIERARRAKFLGFSFSKRKGEVYIRLANRASPLRQDGRHRGRNQPLYQRLDSLLPAGGYAERVSGTGRMDKTETETDDLETLETGKNTLPGTG